MRRPFSPGTLRHTVQHWRNTVTREDDGGLTETPTLLATRKANVEELDAREAMSAQRQEAVASHRITMRHVSDLTPKDWFVYDGRTLNITSVRETTGHKHVTEVLCREKL